MGETVYTVFVRIPYEGEHDAFTGTLSQLMEWLRGDRYEYGYSIDDMTVYENTNLNLNDLVQEC